MKVPGHGCAHYFKISESRGTRRLADDNSSRDKSPLLLKLNEAKMAPHTGCFSRCDWLVKQAC